MFTLSNILDESPDVIYVFRKLILGNKNLAQSDRRVCYIVTSKTPEKTTKLHPVHVVLPGIQYMTGGYVLDATLPFNIQRLG